MNLESKPCILDWSREASVLISPNLKNKKNEEGAQEHWSFSASNVVSLLAIAINKYHIVNCIFCIVKYEILVFFFNRFDFYTDILL